MVEVNLTSNDVILGIKGTDHPLAAYRAAHVPWALSTDDEGVSRIDLTHEYVKGALETEPLLRRPEAERPHLTRTLVPPRRKPLYNAGRFRTPQTRLRRRDHGWQLAVALLPTALPGRERESRAAVGTGTEVRRLRSVAPITHRFATVCATLFARKIKPERKPMKRAIAIILGRRSFFSSSSLPARYGRRSRRTLAVVGCEPQRHTLFCAGRLGIYGRLLCNFFLLIGAARRQLRSAVLTSTVAVVLALVLGLAMKFGFAYPLILQDLPFEARLILRNPHLPL